MDACIRRFREDDAPALTALTVAAIRAIGARAYSPDQVAGWAARHTDAARFCTRAKAGDTILVAADGDDAACAYTVLEPDGHLDMLYCHPDHAGHGLAAALLAAAEQQARAAGGKRLFTEASELARPVFARAGYVLLHRRDFTIPHAGRAIPIHNYAMEKPLG